MMITDDIQNLCGNAIECISDTEENTSASSMHFGYDFSKL